MDRLRLAFVACGHRAPPRRLGDSAAWLRQRPSESRLQALERRTVVLPRLGDGFYSEPPAFRQAPYPWGELTDRGLDEMAAVAAKLGQVPELLRAPNVPGCVEAAMALSAENAGVLTELHLTDVLLPTEAEEDLQVDAEVVRSAAAALAAAAGLPGGVPTGAEEGAWKVAELADGLAALGVEHPLAEAAARAAAPRSLPEDIAIEDGLVACVVQPATLAALANGFFPARWPSPAAALLVHAGGRVTFDAGDGRIRVASVEDGRGPNY